MNKVYEYTYDIESGGLLLNDSPTGMSKEPRPVYAWELDMLGVDNFYHYNNQNNVPYMWAEAHRYFYRGVNIFNTKGGTLFEKPEIILATKKGENGDDIPIMAEGTELLPVDIELMNQRNHDLMEVVEQVTVKKIWNVYKKYKNKIDRFHVALSGGKDSIVLLELVKRTLYVYIHVRRPDYYNRKKNLLNNWLNEQCGIIFNEIMHEVHQKFIPYGVDYPQLKLRNMTSRWGSCLPNKGIITLNKRLIEAPKNCIEYVVYHEFCHFIHPNHSKQFYSLLQVMLPDWRESKQLLENCIVL